MKKLSNEDLEHIVFFLYHLDESITEKGKQQAENIQQKIRQILLGREVLEE